MKVIWRDEATANLENIYTYISLYHAEERARSLVNRLVARADDLGDFPEMGRVVPELQDPDIRELLEKGYRIVYRVKRDAVEVLTVFHASRTSPYNSP
jgi:toxin ParE1/3/4